MSIDDFIFIALLAVVLIVLAKKYNASLPAGTVGAVRGFFLGTWRFFGWIFNRGIFYGVGLIVFLIGIPALIFWSIGTQTSMKYKAERYDTAVARAALPLDKLVWTYSYNSPTSGKRDILWVCWDVENRESTLDLTGGRLNFDLCQGSSRGELVGTVSTVWNESKRQYEGTLHNFVDNLESEVQFTPPIRGTLRQEGLSGLLIGRTGGYFEQLLLRPSS